MPHTAMHEHFGGSLMRTIGASEPLPLPFKPGCARLCYYTASTTGLQVQTPDARRLTPGSRPQYLVCCDPGGDDIDVYDGSGSPIDALTGGECLELILADNATAAGTWLARKFTFAAGTPLATNRQPLSFRFDTPRNDLAMLYHAQAHGWDGESPVALMVTIGAGVVIGSSSSNPADAALWIGGFPTGSTVVLMLEAGSYVSGRGGAGGRGGDAPSGLLAMNGLPGGLALSLGHPTALVSYGTIQGGGGGGGG
ncbi:MAG: hypothetical protein KDE27_08035, partial [Planctomycetes bacterium]|nr:hypothetical protein [Planctomycetota bacterium]